ncbi:response regulator [Roseateles sp. SL47]|uniref:response regulator n=1 Tax=Roseateles sp. SL47 TaxID=2995138 RepID=UPI002270AB54|nr:response regulator [Roseateles sp. SL47]WAC74342.1 response regulator [Roseateles sp. SL47]
MNVVIVESSSTLRAQLVALLAREQRIHVVGEAADEQMAIQLIAQTQPDAVLMDLALQPGSGLRVLRAIRQLGCGARVVVLSNSFYEEMLRACSEYRISGFFDKSTQVDEALEMLRRWLPPLMVDEPQRVAVVEQLESRSLAFSAFDELADLACDISGSGMATISLINADTQRFIGMSGLAFGQMPRSRSLCAQILHQGPLVEVPDTWHDTRFADHPLVQGAPYVRFYAAVPLALSGGEVVGSLCVLDRLPRRLRERQREALLTLSRCAINELESTRRHSAPPAQAISAAMTL